MTKGLKVGALAKRAGLTVRTLHHYDEIGLLSPSGRTPAGHRLYSDRDVARLQQIASLRHLGLPLAEIRACLARPEFTLEHTLDLQIERIESQIARQEQLRNLVGHLRDRLRDDDVSLEELTRTIELTMTFERHYAPEQLERLRQRRGEVGEERITDAQREWGELFAAFAKAMEEGAAPESEEVQALARRSADLIAAFTGGDPDILESLTGMYEKEGPEAVLEGHGTALAPGLWEYMARARAALG